MTGSQVLGVMEIIYLGEKKHSKQKYFNRFINKNRITLLQGCVRALFKIDKGESWISRQQTHLHTKMNRKLVYT